MNKIINNKVIIWGPDDFNTLGLLRQLGSAGIDIFFLIKEKKGMLLRAYIVLSLRQQVHLTKVSLFFCQHIQMKLQNP